MMNSLFSYSTYRQIRHILTVWFIETIALLLLDIWLPGMEIQTRQAAILAIALIGLLNAILRPLVLSFTITITVFTLGLFSFLLNVGILLLVVQIVPGFVITNGQTAILVVLGVTLINMLITQIFSLNEDDSYYRTVIRRLGKTHAVRTGYGRKGLLILQLDGLSKTVLEKAILAGYMPVLKDLMDHQGYQLKSWNCGLPSQTSACQLGILYGQNEDIPAFRWYEKENQKLIVSNHLRDTALIESRVDKTDSLLAQNASSIGNMFSGNAVKSAMTMSQLASAGQISMRSDVFYNFYLNPYNFTRTIFLMIAELGREVYQNLAQWFSRRKPRMQRTLLFALERAVAVVFLRELTTHIIIEDIFSRYQTIYATFLGYDVVAHHTGISSPAVFSVLRGLDKQIQRIQRANSDTGNWYDLVVLSDHGQSQGEHFQQRFGISLEQFVRSLIKGDPNVVSTGASEEVKGYVNSLLTEVLNPHQKVKGSVKRIYQQLRSDKGDFTYFEGPARPTDPDADVIICPSGNMALIYFPQIPQRLTLRQISDLFPTLIVDLSCHEGIGLVMVHSDDHGPLLFHAGGMHVLKTGQIEGQDILRFYPKNTRSQLMKLNQFKHCGDLVVFSRFNPETGETPAFEALLGHHGGIGGLQTDALVCFPASFPWNEEINDSIDLHQQLRKWQDLQLGGFPRNNLQVSIEGDNRPV